MSSQQPKKFYLTTPIYYVNARPHIGHAYTTIVADVLARRHRLLGEDTFFLTGTDEHGQKIERSAAAAGVPPQQFADQVSAEFRKLWDRMGLLEVPKDDPLFHRRYIRTTDECHKRGVQKLFAELYKNGHIYLDSYTGAYCVSDEAFVDVPVGTPCPDCGRITESVTEENFFFKLSAFQRPLLDLIESGTLKIEPETRRNEVLSFLRGGLKDLSISRSSFTWGIPVPEPAASAAKQKHVIYVWLDALANYMTAIGYGSDDPKDQAEFARYWPADLHLVGKEIIRFHCVYWPAFLLGLNTAYGNRSSSGLQPAEEAPTQSGALALGTSSHAVILSEASQRDAKSKDPEGLNATTSADTFLIAENAAPNSQPSQLQQHGSSSGLQPAEQAHTDSGALAPATPPNAVILSEASQRDAESKDPENISTTTSADIFPTKDIAAIPPQLSFEQHKLWAENWLPKAITAHGWLLFDNAKMSKSKGNIVRAETILEAFGTLCPPIHETTSNGATPGKDTASAAPAETGTNAASHQARSGKGTASAVPPEAQTKGALAPEVRPPAPHERDLFATDVLRYFLLREIPFGQDGSFSFEAIVTRYNADLTNAYGNLVSRTLTLANAHFHTEAERPHEPWLCEEWKPDPQKKEITSVAEATSGTATLITTIGLLADIDFNFYVQKNEFHLALNYVFNAITSVDSYLSWHKPWLLAKNIDSPIQKAKLIEILYTAAESIRIITALLYPILPFSTARVWQQLGLGDIEEAARNGELNNLQWGGLKPGTKLGPLAPIFPRADKGLAQIMMDIENARSNEQRTTDNEERTTTHPAAPPRALDEPSGTLPVAGSTAISTEREHTPHTEAPASGIFGGASTSTVAKLSAATSTNTGSSSGLQPAESAPTQSGASAPGSSTDSPQITIDDFAKVELRVAQILVAERIPKADKLLRLEVDLGHEKRQILSGIAEWYAPEDLIGRRIVVITNLAPRKMRGLESHGMLLAASEGEGGKPVLATMAEDIALGSRLK